MTAKTIWLFVMYTLIFSIFNSFLTAAQNPYMIRAFVDKAVISKWQALADGNHAGFHDRVHYIPVLMARLATSDGGWHALILIYAIPLGLIGILRMIFVREDTSIDAGNTAQKVDVKQIITMLAKNRYIWAYAGISGFYNLTVGLNVSTFYFKYVVGNVGLLGVMSALSMVLLPVMIVFPKLMKKFSVCNLIEMGSAAAMLGCALIFVAKANMILLIAGSVLVALASLPIAYLGVLIVMELSTYNEWNGLPRMEGSTNIVSNFAARVFNGIGVALQGGVLSLFGYVSGSGAAVTQPEARLWRSAVFTV
jgi:probable glucitol transport protein GutA